MVEETEKEKEEGMELIPVKIRRKTFRILKTLASWREMSIVDYLQDLVDREGQGDIKRMLADLEKETRRKK